MADGPHGVRRGKATCFPGSLAQAASWDRDLIGRIGIALGKEFRAKGCYVGLGPCINIIRDPRGGRSFETMGEDPYLIAQLATEYVKGVQSQKVITTPKHFVCNNQENERFQNDVQVPERSLQEMYLPAFKACVVDGGALGIMSAYNQVRGEFCSQNAYLLNDILKNQWQFKGFVVSDWGACHSTVESINAGLDVEMPRAKFYGKPLFEAVEKGQVSERTVDEAVRRILRTKFWAGVFDKPLVADESRVNTPEHQALALEAARKAIVLLKNDDNLLPLDKNKIKRIALIGPNAAIARPTGGGSSRVNPYYAVSPMDGLKNKLGDSVEINYVKGCSIKGEDALYTIKSSNLRPKNGRPGQTGLLAQYYNNINLEGPAVVKRIDAEIDFDWKDGSPAPDVNVDRFSAIWQGSLVPDDTGQYKIGITADDSMRLFLDGKLLFKNWRSRGKRTRMTKVDLEAGREYDIRIEYYEASKGAMIKLGWDGPGHQPPPFHEARQAAANADVAVVVVGNSLKEESEGDDRPHLDLPGQQNNLISAVTEANPKTIVILVNGSAVLMDKWISKVPAVLEAWFAGQEVGNAIADCLFGDYNPAAKLPVTFPMAQEQLPPFNNDYEQVGEGRGYRYYDKKNLKPLFPFGHGLSYTTFEYSNIEISPQKSGIKEPVIVSLDVTNTGSRTGDEIVQLYVHDIQTSLDRPIKELKGFKRLTLKPGQTKKAVFGLKKDALAFYDTSAGAFVVEPGEFEILVGASSRDIRLSARLQKQ